MISNSCLSLFQYCRIASVISDFLKIAVATDYPAVNPSFYDTNRPRSQFRLSFYFYNTIHRNGNIKNVFQLTNIIIMYIVCYIS